MSDQEAPKPQTMQRPKSVSSKPPSKPSTSQLQRYSGSPSNAPFKQQQNNSSVSPQVPRTTKNSNNKLDLAAALKKQQLLYASIEKQPPPELNQKSLQNPQNQRIFNLIERRKRIVNGKVGQQSNTSNFWPDQAQSDQQQQRSPSANQGAGMLPQIGSARNLQTNQHKPKIVDRTSLLEIDAMRQIKQELAQERRTDELQLKKNRLLNQINNHIANGGLPSKDDEEPVKAGSPAAKDLKPQSVAQMLYATYRLTEQQIKDIDHLEQTGQEFKRFVDKNYTHLRKWEHFNQSPVVLQVKKKKPILQEETHGEAIKKMKTQMQNSISQTKLTEQTNQNFSLGGLMQNQPQKQFQQQYFNQQLNQVRGKDNKSPFNKKLLLSPPLSPSANSTPAPEQMVIREENEDFLGTKDAFKSQKGGQDTKNTTFYTQGDQDEGDEQRPHKMEKRVNQVTFVRHKASESIDPSSAKYKEMQKVLNLLEKTKITNRDLHKLSKQDGEFRTPHLSPAKQREQSKISTFKARAQSQVLNDALEHLQYEKIAKCEKQGIQYQRKVQERLRNDLDRRLKQEHQDNEMLTYCCPNIVQAIMLNDEVAINPMNTIASNVRVESKITTFKQNQRIHQLLTRPIL